MPPKEKSKELKHRNIICLKLTDIELEILNRAASSVGISRSEYLRRLFLNKPIQINYQIASGAGRAIRQNRFQSEPDRQVF